MHGGLRPQLVHPATPCCCWTGPDDRGIARSPLPPRGRSKPASGQGATKHSQHQKYSSPVKDSSDGSPRACTTDKLAQATSGTEDAAGEAGPSVTDRQRRQGSIVRLRQRGARALPERAKASDRPKASPPWLGCARGAAPWLLSPVI